MNAVADILLNFSVELWRTLCEMSPYLLFGFLLAGLLSYFISREWISRHLGGHGLWPVIKAALLGVPLPLCSCSVIPVAASLRRHGAGRGGAVAFLIATPQTSVDSILVTLSLLGPVFAVARPFIALITGLAGGALVDVIEPHGEADVQEPEECADACCAPERGFARIAGALRYGFGDLARDIGPSLLIGLLIAGAIAAFVPDEYFAGVGRSPWGILLLMLAGIPVYVCATASVPVAAALVMKGVSPGAALAFLMTGPATNAAGIITVWRIMGFRSAATYLGTVAAGALGGGLLLNYFMDAAVGTAGPGASGWMLPEAVKHVSAGALIAVLALSFLRETPHEHGDDEHEHDEESCHH
jgi:hypothetical protein